MTASVSQVLDAAGFDVILIETVGAGQSEVDIARLAHTVIVVEAPGLGDDIQAIKAGILEIADILAVNKCDLPGAEQTARQLRAMLEMAHPTRPGNLPEDQSAPIWLPPVILSCTQGCQGIDEIIQAANAHREFLKTSGEWARREQERLKNGLEAMISAALLERWRGGLEPGEFERILDGLTERKISPFEAVDKLLDG